MDGTGITTWVCIVCGYVHRGSGPPDSCPICGAAQEDFEPSAETPPAERPAARRWRCLICNYIHSGAEPPVECPLCGASADDFEPIEEAAGRSAGHSRNAEVVILGGGIAGISAAEAIREASPESPITLITKDSDLPYYRLNLTRYLAGEIARDALPIHPQAWYDEHRIRLLLNQEVKAISPNEQLLYLDAAKTGTFEKLIICAGAHPFVPPILGATRKGVMAFRTIEDADALLAAAKPGARCVCIGGGILGLETAGGLAKQGMTVTVLEGYEWLLPRQLNREAGTILERHVAGLGITVKNQAKTSEILGDERVTGVALADGGVLPADLVVITAGVRPTSHLARSAGLTVDQGIVVDSRLTTSHPDILAAGDVAEHHGILYGLWEPARFQGMMAGRNAVGLDDEFGGLPRANTLKVLGVGLFSVGVIQPPDGSYTVLADERDGCYYRFVFHDNRLEGAIFVGDTRLAVTVTKVIKSGTDCSKALAEHPNTADILAYFGESMKREDA